MAVQYGEAAAWAREAGYDGLQLASSNAKLLDQLLSPFWNRRDDEFGGSLERAGQRAPPHPRADRRARRRRLHRHRQDPGGGEGAAVHRGTPRGTRASSCAGWSRSSATTRSRPWRCRCSPTPRSRVGASPRRSGRTRPCRPASARPRRGGASGACSWRATCAAALTARFRPVWNRSRFDGHEGEPCRSRCWPSAASATPTEVDEILDGGQADLVGIGRPFYAEPDLPRAHPRRQHRARAVPVLEPVRARADARDEGRLLQPRRREAGPRREPLAGPTWAQG